MMHNDLPFRSPRLYNLYAYVSRVPPQEVAHRTHFLALREAELETKRYGSFLQLLLPPKTVRARVARFPDVLINLVVERGVAPALDLTHPLLKFASGDPAIGGGR